MEHTLDTYGTYTTYRAERRQYTTVPSDHMSTCAAVFGDLATGLFHYCNRPLLLRTTCPPVPQYLVKLTLATGLFYYCNRPLSLLQQASFTLATGLFHSCNRPLSLLQQGSFTTDHISTLLEYPAASECTSLESMRCARATHSRSSGAVFLTNDKC